MNVTALLKGCCKMRQRESSDDSELRRDKQGERVSCDHSESSLCKGELKNKTYFGDAERRQGLERLVSASRRQRGLQRGRCHANVVDFVLKTYICYCSTMTDQR